ncbi:hypothetical protein JZ751_023002, partial [Albula glossodonta]
MNECAHVELNNCSPEADCLNTEGSYNCYCHPGFVDVGSNITGIHCQDKDNETQGEPPWPRNSTRTLCGHSNGDLCDSGETFNMSHRTSPGECAHNCSHTADTTNTTRIPPEQGTWASPTLNTEPLPNITSQWETSTGTMEVTALKQLSTEYDGTMAYDMTQWTSNVPNADSRHTDWSSSAPIQSASSTAPPADAPAVQTLRAVARLTNMQFKEAFLNSSSQEYLNLTKDIEREVHL